MAKSTFGITFKKSLEIKLLSPWTCLITVRSVAVGWGSTGVASFSWGLCSRFWPWHLWAFVSGHQSHPDVHILVSLCGRRRGSPDSYGLLMTAVPFSSSKNACHPPSSSDTEAVSLPILWFHFIKRQREKVSFAIALFNIFKFIELKK